MKPNIHKQESTIYVEPYLTLVETVDLEGQDPFGTIECDRSMPKEARKAQFIAYDKLTNPIIVSLTLVFLFRFASIELLALYTPNHRLSSNYW
jgi:hypothetical protein